MEWRCPLVCEGQLGRGDCQTYISIQSLSEQTSASFTWMTSLREWQTDAVLSIVCSFWEGIRCLLESGWMETVSPLIILINDLLSLFYSELLYVIEKHSTLCLFGIDRIHALGYSLVCSARFRSEKPTFETSVFANTIRNP